MSCDTMSTYTIQRFFYVLYATYFCAIQKAFILREMTD